MTRIDRRQFGALLGGFASCLCTDACGLKSEALAGSDGRLTARPNKKTTTTAVEGAQPLELERGRDAILPLPATPSSDPVPLLVLLHGASGSGQGMLRRLAAAIDESGIAVLAPDSRDGTWDAIRDGFGRDVAFLDRALARVFDTAAVDPDRVAV